MRKYRPAATLADSLLHTLAHFYEHNTQASQVIFNSIISTSYPLSTGNRHISNE